MIANTVFQPLYGRLSDIFGRKGVFLSALTLLVLADALCGSVQTSTQLFLCRGLAGVATGGISALTQMIISDVVTLGWSQFHLDGGYLSAIIERVQILTVCDFRETWGSFIRMPATIITIANVS